LGCFCGGCLGIMPRGQRLHSVKYFRENPLNRRAEGLKVITILMSLLIFKGYLSVDQRNSDFGGLKWRFGTPPAVKNFMGEG